MLIALLLFFFDFPACVRSRKRSYAFRSAAEDAFLPPGLAAVWPTAERRKELAPGSLVEAGSRTSFIRLRSHQPEMFRRKKRNDPKSGLASPNHTTTLTAPVLGCIEIKFCNQRFFCATCFSRSTRFAYCCTAWDSNFRIAPNSKCQDFAVVRKLQ